MKKKKKEDFAVEKTKEELLNELAENISNTKEKIEEPNVCDESVKHRFHIENEQGEDKVTDTGDLLEVCVPFVFTREAFERMQNRCLRMGFVDFSDYVRDLTRNSLKF